MLSPLVFTLGFLPRAVVNGFFVAYTQATVLHTIASGASGPAWKKTATRYATVDLMMVNAQADAQMLRVAKSARTAIPGTTGLPVIQRPDRLRHH